MWLYCDLFLFFTGATPYPGMGAREVMRRVRDGYRSAFYVFYTENTNFLSSSHIGISHSENGRPDIKPTYIFISYIPIPLKTKPVKKTYTVKKPISLKTKTYTVKKKKTFSAKNKNLSYTVKNTILTFKTNTYPLPEHNKTYIVIFLYGHALIRNTKICFFHRLERPAHCHPQLYLIIQRYSTVFTV